MSEQVIILLIGTSLMLFSATIRRMRAAAMQAAVETRSDARPGLGQEQNSLENLTVAVEAGANLV
jgi:hypothetical protein